MNASDGWLAMLFPMLDILLAASISFAVMFFHPNFVHVFFSLLD